MSPRRDKRRYGRTAKDVRRGGLGARTPKVIPTIKDVSFWLRKNGVNISSSSTVQSMTDVNEREAVSFSNVVQLQSGDYVELMFAVNDLNVILNTIAATASIPLTPSITLSVVQI